MRQEYNQGQLLEENADPDPMRQFRTWFGEAHACEQPWFEPNAMTVATSVDAVPSARIVLCKGVDSGFVFYTNTHSHKGQQLAQNPRAALVFHWAPLERQVRIEGLVEVVDEGQARAYFATRPLESRLGAWASDQSELIADRDALDKQFEMRRREHENQEVDKPPHWGGYRVRPLQIEFWQGRVGRMHDRLVYSRATLDGPWTRVRLQP